MSRFKTVVPVPLGEIRRIEGKLGASMLAGQLVTIADSFTAGASYHAQNEGATFTLNAVKNAVGVSILVEQEDMVLSTDAINVTRPANSWGRAHVLKQGEEVTVVLAAAATIAAGNLLEPAADGKVSLATAALGATGYVIPMFSAIESAATTSTGDGLRILARVL